MTDDIAFGLSAMDRSQLTCTISTVRLNFNRDKLGLNFCSARHRARFL